MRTIIVTGAAGFIGSLICQNFVEDYRIIALDKKRLLDINKDNYVPINGDVTDINFWKYICNKYIPDVIVHCAEMANQNFFCTSTTSAHEEIDAHVTENLVKEAVLSNSGVYFIFLSSILVYGENYINKQIKETDQFNPTCDYANNKIEIENRLKQLYDNNILKKIDVMRLAPVYNLLHAANLEKRVVAPRKLFFVKFGSGEQRISVLSVLNLMGFITLRIKNNTTAARSFHKIFNVCDKESYSFDEIINILQDSSYCSHKRIIKVPIIVLRFFTNFLCVFLKGKSAWIYSCYNKLVKGLIVDNKKMLDTGFNPRYGLKFVFKKNSNKQKI